MADPIRFVRPGDPDDLPVVVVVQEGDGAWTPGPCVQIEVGNVVEMDVGELEWLLEDAGPKALAKLREMEA